MSSLKLDSACERGHLKLSQVQDSFLLICCTVSIYKYQTCRVLSKWSISFIVSWHQEPPGLIWLLVYVNESRVRSLPYKKTMSGFFNQNERGILQMIRTLFFSSSLRVHSSYTATHKCDRIKINSVWTLTFPFGSIFSPMVNKDSGRQSPAWAQAVACLLKL